MKTSLEKTLKTLFEHTIPPLDSLTIRIECPFDSGIGVQCVGKTEDGLVYPEPDMDVLSDYIDEQRSAYPGERFNIVKICMTSPKEVVIERTFDETFQREAEDMVRD